MSNISAISLKFAFAWWVWPYLNTCRFVAWASGCEPDADAIVATILKHGVRFEIDK